MKPSNEGRKIKRQKYETEKEKKRLYFVLDHHVYVVRKWIERNDVYYLHKIREDGNFHNRM